MRKDYENYIDVYLKEIVQICGMINKEHIADLAQKINNIKQNDGRLFIFGVGGSAANASHAVNDFRKILGIETYSAFDNVSELTARINDDGWDTSLVEWLKISKFSSSDTIMILSVGGGSESTSQNLVQVMQYAKSVGGEVTALVSRDGGYAKKLSDTCVLIPPIEDSRITPHAEEWQAILWHMIVSCVKTFL